MTMPVWGRLSFEESYPSTANQQLPRAKQGEVKGGRSYAPAREDELCLLSGLWSQGLFTQP